MDAVDHSITLKTEVGEEGAHSGRTTEVEKEGAHSGRTTEVEKEGAHSGRTTEVEKDGAHSGRTTEMGVEELWGNNSGKTSPFHARDSSLQSLTEHPASCTDMKTRDLDLASGVKTIEKRKLFPICLSPRSRRRRKTQRPLKKPTGETTPVTLTDDTGGGTPVTLTDYISTTGSLASRLNDLPSRVPSITGLSNALTAGLGPYQSQLSAGDCSQSDGERDWCGTAEGGSALNARGVRGGGEGDSCVEAEDGPAFSAEDKRGDGERDIDRDLCVKSEDGLALNLSADTDSHNRSVAASSTQAYDGTGTTKPTRLWLNREDTQTKPPPPVSEETTGGRCVWYPSSHSVYSNPASQALAESLMTVTGLNWSEGDCSWADSGHTSHGQSNLDPSQLSSGAGKRRRAGRPQKGSPKTYTCADCDATFKRPDHLTRHQRKHAREALHPKVNGPKLFGCEHCSASFNRHDHLARHVRRHTGERPFACTVCNATFTQSSSLTIHVQKHTGERRYYCKECDASFTDFPSLKSHARAHSDSRQYACTQCRAVFPKPYNLAVHMRKHTGERPFQCAQCHATFIQSNHLTRHMRSHTGEKPYSCTQCGSSFSDSSILTKHMRVHTGEKPFQCPHCSASFAQSCNLTRHALKHTAQTPHS